MGALKFRVVVDTDKEEDIFRDIQIGDELTFENLFHAIISAFEFEGNQLASFYLSNNDWDKGREIGLIDMGFEGDEDDENTPLVMASSVLKEHCETKGQKVILVYDFLSMWCFLIELIEINEETVESAELVLSVGVSPKESEREPEYESKDKPETEKDEFGLPSFEDEVGGFEGEEEFGDFENIDDLDI